MAKLSQITARIDAKVKLLTCQWCQSHGLVMAKFIEDALLDKLEEHIDSAEIEKLRREPTRPFREVMKELS